jgi:hypothetical protein
MGMGPFWGWIHVIPYDSDGYMMTENTISLLLSASKSSSSPSSSSSHVPGVTGHLIRVAWTSPPTVTYY